MGKLRVNATHVVIGDSDPLARRVIRQALQDGAGFVIPGEASTGPEAVELCLYYRPQVALMEVSLPDLDGLSATRHILDPRWTSQSSSPARPARCPRRGAGCPRR